MNIFVVIFMKSWVATTETLLLCGDIEANPGALSSGNEFLSVIQFPACFRIISKGHLSTFGRVNIHLKIEFIKQLL